MRSPVLEPVERCLIGTTPSEDADPNQELQDVTKWSDGYTTASDDIEDDPEHFKETPPSPLSPASKPPSEQKKHHCTVAGCGKSFNRPARLAEHLRSHNNERPFKCKEPQCEKSFLRDAHLQHHIKSAHTKIRDHPCLWEGCGKKFLTATRLRRHQNVHEGKNKYRCTGYEDCNEVFRKHSTLQQHVAVTHLKQKPFVCPHFDASNLATCSKEFETAARLRIHQKRMHGEQRYWCRDCPSRAHTKGGDPDLSFTSSKSFQKHLGQFHRPQCSLCDQTCSTIQGVRRHETAVHGIEDGTMVQHYICEAENCQKVFNRLTNLVAHGNTVHKNERPFACGLFPIELDIGGEKWDIQNGCSRSFAAKANLIDHVRTQHLGLVGKGIKRKHPVSMVDKTPPWRKRRNPTLSALTGVTSSSLPVISCIIKSCTFQSTQELEMTSHLLASHMLNEVTVSELIANGAAKTNDMTTFNPFLDIEKEMERGAENGGTFWMSSGGLQNYGQPEIGLIDLQHLTDREDEEPNSLIDPTLTNGGVN